ncbi:protein spaetzle isoform X3 [Ceratitis capitata]|uniref:protein spaetzle isoform X3 n=1 Tax=Ceratitis capitata TaxID=7213 RepID=UPI000329AEF4|nr:protein spaetzle isoform X3 [Ceratitis capitata]
MFKMRQTSWSLRPALPLLMLAFFMLTVSPIDGKTYDLRTARHKRAPKESIDRHHSPQGTKMLEKDSEELDARLGDIFQTGNGTGLVLFNTTTAASPTHNQKNPKTQQNSNERNDAIIFPDVDDYYCNERREGKPYCTEVPNYAELAGLDDISPESFEQFKSYFKDDHLQPINVTQRMNSEPLEEYLCPSSSRLIHPKTAEAKGSKWVTLVQDANHQQGIVVELCDEEEKPCRYFDSLPKSYQTRCKQNYVYRTVVVVVDGKMREEQVKMPNCCKCAVRNTLFS